MPATARAQPPASQLGPCFTCLPAGNPSPTTLPLWFFQRPPPPHPTHCLTAAFPCPPSQPPCAPLPMLSRGGPPCPACVPSPTTTANGQHPTFCPYPPAITLTPNTDIGTGRLLQLPYLTCCTWEDRPLPWTLYAPQFALPMPKWTYGLCLAVLLLCLPPKGLGCHHSS